MEIGDLSVSAGGETAQTSYAKLPLRHLRASTPSLVPQGFIATALQKMILGNFCGDGFAGVHMDGAVGIQKLQSDFDRIPKINECHRVGLTENGQGLPGREIVPMGPASQPCGFLFGPERERMVSPVVSSVRPSSKPHFDAGGVYCPRGALQKSP